MLIKSGANVKLQNPRTGDNILHSALQNRNCSEELIKYLIQMNENLVIESNGSNFDALDLARTKGHSDSIVTIIRSAIKDEEYLMERLSLKDRTESSDSDKSDESENDIEDSKEDVSKENISYKAENLKDDPIIFKAPEESEKIEKLFDEKCLNLLSSLLNENEKWREVAMLMGFDDLSTEWTTSENPSKILLTHIEVNAY